MSRGARPVLAAEEEEVQRGAEHTRIEEGIDTYWKQLNTPEFIVFHELNVAARTDPELAEVLVSQGLIAASRADLQGARAWWRRVENLGAGMVYPPLVARLAQAVGA